MTAHIDLQKKPQEVLGGDAAENPPVRIDLRERPAPAPITIDWQGRPFRLLLRWPSAAELLLNDQLVIQRDVVALMAIRTRCIIGWEGLELIGADGQPMELGEKALEELLSYPRILTAVVAGLSRVFGDEDTADN